MRKAQSKNQWCSFFPVDVSKFERVRETMTEAAKQFGQPHLLINSAGKSYPNYFEEISFDVFDQVIKTNLYGVRNTIACLVPYMKEEGGHIVNISSSAGISGVFGFTAYSAAKFGVIGFSESLRSELKPHNIFVSVLCPPDTNIPMLQEENKIKPPECKAISETSKVMSPEQVSRELLKGVQKKKFLIIPGLDGKITHMATRFFPGLLNILLIAKSIRYNTHPQ